MRQSVLFVYFFYATSGKYSNQVVPELLAMEALYRWRK